MTKPLLFTLSLCLSVLATATTPKARNPLLGLPPTPTSQENPALATLGQKLFSDVQLSADGKISCASCHLPTQSFSDGRARSKGHKGREGTRNAPTLLNVAYSTTLFWDGRATDLETQARAPLLNPTEHALPDEDSLTRILRETSTYPAEFEKALGIPSEKITIDAVARALAAYERTLRAGDSPFDRYEYAGDQNAMNASAVRGLALFRGRAQCMSCHEIGKKSALFTDDSFHISPTGIPPGVTAELGQLASKVNKLRADTRPGSRATLEGLIATDSRIAALGRFIVTQDPRDIGHFKTPSLRNVALTAPYMHDGSVVALEDAVDLELYGRGKAVKYPIVLTTEEKKDLVEFLRALTSTL